MLLSIVVPVYNVEAYLRKCVDSILAQDLDREDYEIILVDDGSTDKSGDICNEIESLASNIIVLHKENGGLSSARNAGIEIARGDYIQFVDSDDYLSPNVLGNLISQINNKRLDILRFSYQNVDSQGQAFEPNKTPKPFADFSSEVCDGITFLNERLGYACYAVQFILKTKLVKTPGNQFKEGIFFEDVEWTPRILIQADRIASTPLIAYNYLFRTGSITRNQDIERAKKMQANRFLLLDSLKALANTVDDHRWFEGMIAHISLAIINTISTSFYGDRKAHLSKLKEQDVFPLSTYNATKSARRRIRLANISPRLLCFLRHYRASN